MTLPPGFVVLTLGKGCVCVIPARVYVAGLRLGKTLRRRMAMEKREPSTPGGSHDADDT